MKLFINIAAISYIPLQCTWGIFQTILGFAISVLQGNAPHYRYHKAIVTQWNSPYGLSLGLFIFLPSNGGERLLAHEYGHTLQSLLLGPLYLPIIGIPSVLWARLPYFQRKRNKQNKDYYAFYTERWADRWGSVQKYQ